MILKEVHTLFITKMLFDIKNKKGVSVIIGYILLISFGLVLAVLVYNYLKTYVPSDPIDCPEGVSIFIRDYDCSTSKLNLTLKNNGRFNIAGYYIYYSNDSTREIATNSFSPYFQKTIYSQIPYKQTYILFDIRNSSAMYPGKEFEHKFAGDLSNVKYIEIVPVRFEEKNGKDLFSVCTKASIKQVLECS